MIDHISTYATDYDATRRFYQGALAPLGYALQVEMVASWDAEFPTRRICAFGPAGKGAFWIIEVKTAASPRHVAFAAADRAGVAAFHRAALAAGGRDHGAPGMRPHYTARYFGDFVIDPTGHTVDDFSTTPAGTAD